MASSVSPTSIESDPPPPSFDTFTSISVPRLRHLVTSLQPPTLSNPLADRLPNDVSHIPIRIIYRIQPLSFLPDTLVIGRQYKQRVILVNENGLFLRGSIHPDSPLLLNVSLLYSKGNGAVIEQSEHANVSNVRIQSRQMVEFSEKGKCEIEFELALDSDDHLRAPHGTDDFYLRFHSSAPVPIRVNEGHSNFVLDLVYGPFKVSLLSEVDEVLGAVGLPRATVHRMVGGDDAGQNNSVLLTKEEWDLGIPGKIWDSGVILGRYLSSVNWNQMTTKECGDPFRVLDLSTGNGYLGLLLAYTCSQVYPSTALSICLTDLSDVVPLIRHNLTLNSAAFSSSVSVSATDLLWGDIDAHARISSAGTKKFDLILCSDILYETESFIELLSTLNELCDEKGEIWMGYKFRGLTGDEENMFFKRIKQTFKVQEVVTDGCWEFGVTVVKFVRS
ncbi:putative methyltransferase-domain-containing protein [Paraphysoderma sedebokerense]|nr:putative methyltransferase-domain-containing protein [Paraphysoderma sedebokerense]